MDLKIKGRKALVTGASAGLGAAAAMALAAEGVELYMNARDPVRLETAADKITRATGVKPVSLAADVSTIDGIKFLAEKIGAVDILVSNTGGPPPGQFTDLPEKRWPEAAELLLFSAVRLTRMVIDGMIERRWGRLIYITSFAVLQPVDDLILSNSCRAAVTGLCKTVSNNYAKYGITANCVCPGYTATERLKNLAASRAKDRGISAEQMMQEFAAAAPAGRVGQPEELAALIAFLASDRAAFITGTSIPVDGGVVKALI